MELLVQLGQPNDTPKKSIGDRLREVLGSMCYRREDWGLLFFSFLSHYSPLADLVIFNADTHRDWISNIMFHSRGAAVAHCVCVFFGPLSLHPVHAAPQHSFGSLAAKACGGGSRNQELRQ